MRSLALFQNFKSTTRVFLFVIFFLNLLFIVLYHYKLKVYFLSYSANIETSYGRSYYYNIFSNLELAGFLLSILILLAVIFKKKLQKFVFGLTSYQILAIAIFLIVFIQSAIIIFVKTVPIADSHIYLKYADRLNEVLSFVREDGVLTNFWPVGLPFLISIFKSLFGDPILSFQIFNIFITISYFIILFIVFRKILSEIQLKLFIILFSLFPANWFVVNAVLTDYIFSFLTWVVILLVILNSTKKVKYIGIGLAISLAMYFRSIAILFPLIILCYYFFLKSQRKMFLNFTLILISVIITQAPWVYRNYILFETPTLTSTNGGFNFLMGNHKASKGNINFDFEYNMNNPDEVQESLNAYKTGLNDIMNYPIESLVRLPKKLFYSHYRGDVSLSWTLKLTTNDLPGLLISFLFYLTNFIFFVVVFGGFVQLCLSRNTCESNSSILLIKLFSLYFLIIILLFVGNERYIVPVYPLYFYYFSKIF